VRERSLNDPTMPVPYCTDGRSFCVWRVTDYRAQGLAALKDSGLGQGTLVYDGYFARGYGVSRCAPLPASCGNPGEPCCPSMVDQRISGMVHNRRFKYQPCNYAAGGAVGVYCAGEWQAGLLASGVQLGTCRLNAQGCGRVGRPCCHEEVPEVGEITLCEPRAAPGTHYCANATGMCMHCPAVPRTRDEKENCGADRQISSSGSGGGSSSSSSSGGRRAGAATAALQRGRKL
jgi:hypothetical protein